MKKLINLSKNRWHIVLLFLMGLTPVIWFLGREGILINGSDTNFPLNPEIWFLRRFYVWNPLGNAGVDSSSSIAGLLFHLVQFIPYKLGFSLQQVELISLIFWFETIIFSSYFLSKSFFKKSKITQLIFVNLYSFNVYLFNTWENIKVSNLALVAALPLGLGTLTLLLNNKISYRKSVIYIILSGIILSGSGINPAYFLCFFAVLVFYLFSKSLLSKSISMSVVYIKKFLFMTGLIFFVNLFWIFPTLDFIRNNIGPTGSLGKIGYTNWVDSLSQNTSIINIWRLQGAWDWYSFDSATNTPLYIPYAVNYFGKLPFLGFSFLLPTLALISLVLWKKQQKSLYVFLGVMMFIGIFLGSGTHEPTGTVFKFLIKNLPFFSLFRSPWYIFTPILIISIAGLVSSLFYFLLNSKYRKFRMIIYLFASVIFIGNLVYNYPLIQGKIFRPKSDDNFYIKFPDYVFDAGKWLSKDKNDSRIITYPDSEIERFSWGYNAIESILGLITNKETVYLPLTDSESNIAKIAKVFYSSLKKNETERINAVAGILNADSILEKMDQETLSPSIQNNSKIEKKINFGSWSIYNFSGLNNNSISKIFVGKSFIEATPYKDSFVSAGLINSKNSLIVNPQDSVVTDIHDIPSDQVIIANNYQLNELNLFNNSVSNLSSRLATKDISKAMYDFEIPQDASYNLALERYSLEAFGLNLDKQLQITIDGVPATLKTTMINDTFVYFEEINLKKGNHKIEFFINNLVLDKLSQNFEGYTEDGEGDFEVAVDTYGQHLSILNKSKRDISANFKLEGFDFMSDYFVQIKYHQIYGNTAGILIDQGNERTLVKAQTESMPNYPEWGNFNFYFDPIRTDSFVNIKLLAPKVEDALGTKILYKDLKVYRIFSNQLFLFKENNKDEGSIAKVNYSQKSPVEYFGTVEGSDKSHVLVFSENYSPQWELILKDQSNNKLNIVPKHFTGNIYANAWYIENPPKNYKFTIYYKRQNLFIFGSVISLVAMLASVLGVLIKFKKKT